MAGLLLLLGSTIAKRSWSIFITNFQKNGLLLIPGCSQALLEIALILKLSQTWIMVGEIKHDTSVLLIHVILELYHFFLLFSCVSRSLPPQSPPLGVTVTSILLGYCIKLWIFSCNANWILGSCIAYCKGFIKCYWKCVVRNMAVGHSVISELSICFTRLHFLWEKYPLKLNTLSCHHTGHFWGDIKSTEVTF